MSSLSKLTVVDNGVTKELDIKGTSARAAAAAAQAELDSAKNLVFDDALFDIDTTTSDADIVVKAKVFTGASADADGSAGLVPAPVALDRSKVLSGAGTWVDMPGKTSDLVNDGNGTEGSVFATKGYVDELVGYVEEALSKL